MKQWFTENWFNLFSSLGIIGGLWFTAVSLHSETKTRRIANLLTITANYREIWKELFHCPELARVVDPKADLAKQPVTPQEELFVGQVISHTTASFTPRMMSWLLSGKACVGMLHSFYHSRFRKQFGSRPNCCKISILQHSLNLL